MHTREAATKRRPPPRDRFGRNGIVYTDDADGMRSGRDRAMMYDRALRASNVVEDSRRNREEEEEEEKQRHEQQRQRWQTTTTTSRAAVAESLRASKLEIEIERLTAQLRVMKKDVRLAKADCAREQQTVAHERKRCQELASASNRAMKENEELRIVLEKTETERDELKRDFVDLGDRATVIAKQNEYAKREYERYKKEADEMRAKAKEEAKAAKEAEKKLKTAEKRIGEKFEDEMAGRGASQSEQSKGEFRKEREKRETERGESRID